MRNKCKFMMLVFFLVFFVGAVNHNTIVSNAQTESEREYDKSLRKNARTDAGYRKKYIKMKIVSVSPKKIKIKIENTGSQAYRHGDYKGLFILKKYKKGKWKKMKFEKVVKIRKGVYFLYPNSSKTITIKWKDYYKSKLKKGKYKFVWPSMGTEKFKLK